MIGSPRCASSREPLRRARWTFVFRLLEEPRGGDRERRRRRQREQARQSEPGVELEQGSPGTLDLAVVDDVVQSGFGLFARCYRDGVQRNSSLGGAVRLRLVVNQRGEVVVVEDKGSDLSDRQVIDCIAEGFYALKFPEPQRGNAHVLCRIHFESS